MMKLSFLRVRSWKKKFQLSESREKEKTWSRSDTISTLSAVVAIAAFIVAFQAEIRVRKTERREVEAIAIAVSSKVRSITQGAEQSAQFMQGFIDHRETNPKYLNQIETYIIELARGLEFPELTVLPEQLAALARADSDAAGTLAACSDRLGDIQVDAKKFTDAKPGRLTHTQLSTVQVMPYRLRELREACKASLDALVALVPQLPKIMGPMRGTLGELMEADRSSRIARARGTSIELQIAGEKLISKHATSDVKQEKIAVPAGPKGE